MNAWCGRIFLKTGQRLSQITALEPMNFYQVLRLLKTRLTSIKSLCHLIMWHISLGKITGLVITLFGIQAVISSYATYRGVLLWVQYPTCWGPNKTPIWVLLGSTYDCNLGFTKVQIWLQSWFCWGPNMTAILVLLGSIYDCNLGFVEVQIWLQSW